MATSGSTNFNLTRNQIIERAFQMLGVLGANETLTASDQTLGEDMLNLMIKNWEAEGMGLWSRTEATLFLTEGDGSYTIGGTSSDRIANTVIETTTSAAASSGASAIVATTVTGMTANDKIGIVLSNTSIQWTTISSIVGSTINLGATLTGDVASGARVYTYTSTIGRPMDILQIRYRNDDDIDYELTQLHHDAYYAIADKSITGSPREYFYDPQLNNGNLYIYPTPDTVNGRIKITYSRRLEDFDAAGDTPDFTQEWLLVLVSNLALLLAPFYGKDAKMQSIGAIAQSAGARARSFDLDDGSIFLLPDNSPYAS